MFRRIALTGLLTTLAASCSGGLLDPGPGELAATVRFTTIEGGCWLLEAADGARYEPAVGMPAAFKTDGRRVLVALRERTDLGSFCMVGRLVEVISIRNR